MQSPCTISPPELVRVSEREADDDVYQIYEGWQNKNKNKKPKPKQKQKQEKDERDKERSIESSDVIICLKPLREMHARAGE